MKIAILASGSNGNATYIESNGQGFLIDVGISSKMLVNRFESSGTDINNLKYIFITHEHGDHRKGLKVFLKAHPLKSYLTQGTYEGLPMDYQSQLDCNEVCFIKKDDIIEIGDCKITIIQTHHDSNEPIGFIIEEFDKKLVYITDTGYVDQSYYPALSNADFYIMESNYDVELLWASQRDFYLKKRIDCDHGHMSNVDSALLLSKIVGSKTKTIVLAHISDDCNYYNMPELILKQHKQIYDEMGLDYSKIDFHFGNRNGVTGVFEL